MAKKNKRMTMEDLWHKVGAEGLGYMVTCYCGYKDVPKELEDAWKRASDALNKIQGALDNFGEELERKNED